MLSGYFVSFYDRLRVLTTTSDAALFDIGSKIVEQLALKQEDLSHIRYEEGEITEQVIRCLRSRYLLIRIALVGVCSP